MLNEKFKKLKTVQPSLIVPSNKSVKGFFKALSFIVLKNSFAVDGLRRTLSNIGHGDFEV